MFFEQCVTEAATSAIIQDPKTNMEDPKKMIWRKGGQVEEEEEEGW